MVAVWVTAYTSFSGPLFNPESRFDGAPLVSVPVIVATEFKSDGTNEKESYRLKLSLADWRLMTEALMQQGIGFGKVSAGEVISKSFHFVQKVVATHEEQEVLDGPYTIQLRATDGIIFDKSELKKQVYRTSVSNSNLELGEHKLLLRVKGFLRDSDESFKHLVHRIEELIASQLGVMLYLRAK